MCACPSSTAFAVGLAVPMPAPSFYADGRLVCDELCDEAFAGLGHPELQQHGTFVKPGASP